MSARPPSRGMSTRGAGFTVTPGNGGGAPPPPPTGAVAPGMRPPTAAGFAPPPGTGIGVDVRVAVRPVTQHGLSGLRTSTAAGPGRQVADRSWYLQEMRTKVAEISREIKGMRASCEAAEEDRVTYARLEKKYEERVREVRAQEGELADFNLALDKLRTNTDIRDVEDQVRRMAQHNCEEKRRIDEVFVRRQGSEDEVRRLEAERAEFHRQAAERLAGEGLDQEYAALLERAAAQRERRAEQEARLAELDGRARAARERLEGDEYRTHARGVDLARRRRDLAAKLEELEAESQETLTPDQVRERLLAKVKAANEAIRRLEEQARVLEDTVERTQDEAREREAEAEQAKKHAGKSKKYEALYERDAKMQAFLDAFPAREREELEAARRAQDTVVALTEHISRGLAARDSMPDRGRLAELRQELEFKEQKKEASQGTLERVRKEAEAQRAELAQLELLDQKIATEMPALRARMEAMRAEMASFLGPEEMRENAARRKAELEADGADCARRREAMRQQVQLASRDIEQQKARAEGSETLARLDAMQAKLRAYAQNVHTLSEFIGTRRREGDYVSVRRDAMEIAAGINAGLVAEASV